MSEPDRPETAAEAERRFVEDLVVRGEAVPEGTDPLPSGATHEIVEERDGVPSKVRRRRFSHSDDLDPPGPGPDPDPGPEPMAAPQIAAVFFDLGATLGSPVLSPPPIHLVRFEVFDFTVPVLDELRGRGLRLGVISNTGDDDATAVDAVLQRAGIRDYLEPALRIYSRDVGLRKDSPKIFRLAADRAGEPPRRCIFVGEDPAERAFAEQAGNRTVPHPLLVMDVLDGQRLQRVRVSVPAGAAFADWQAVLRRYRVVPLRMIGTDEPVIEAIAAERAVAQLAALGFRVEFLQAG
jgi:haloacid dehalogenase-like hydrolase